MENTLARVNVWGRRGVLLLALAMARESSFAKASGTAPKDNSPPPSTRSILTTDLQTDCDPVERNKIHVAVVDDDESFGRAIGRLLRAAGFAPVGYSSAEAFLEDTTRAQPDCLVLDIHLGGASGLDLRRHLTAVGRTTPVIFVTAHDEPTIREEAQQAGCSAYLRKPVPGQLLLEAISKAVKRDKS